MRIGHVLRHTGPLDVSLDICWHRELTNLTVNGTARQLKIDRDWLSNIPSPSALFIPTRILPSRPGLSSTDRQLVTCSNSVELTSTTGSLVEDQVDWAPLSSARIITPFGRH